MDTMVVKLKNKYLIVITKHTKTLGNKDRGKNKAYKMRRLGFSLAFKDDYNMNNGQIHFTFESRGGPTRMGE